ncbi:hypothetical protein [Cuniculiplasma divulgatum]|uniref:hypothetical protein n=1 Tax=Cuniculiplasma divulgatum TaxID=1673428 RepID=UPI0015C574C5|nr:hypothetical protein [Cuniculiplasma divulgatum]
MSDLLDHAIKGKYNSMKINDPLIFVKNAIDWDAFTLLLNDLYHNDTCKNHGESTVLTEHVQHGL